MNHKFGSKQIHFSIDLALVACTMVQEYVVVPGAAVLFLSSYFQTTSVFPAGESGSADTVRDPRGFALKFYTDEGNWDLTGNNTPIFFIRDALLVREIHTEIRISCTGMFSVCLQSFVCLFAHA